MRNEYLPPLADAGQVRRRQAVLGEPLAPAGVDKQDGCDVLVVVFDKRVVEKVHARHLLAAAPDEPFPQVVFCVSVLGLYVAYRGARRVDERGDADQLDGRVAHEDRGTQCLAAGAELDAQDEVRNRHGFFFFISFFPYEVYCAMVLRDRRMPCVRGHKHLRAGGVQHRGHHGGVRPRDVVGGVREPVRAGSDYGFHGIEAHTLGGAGVRVAGHSGADVEPGVRGAGGDRAAEGGLQHRPRGRMAPAALGRGVRRRGLVRLFRVDRMLLRGQAADMLARVMNCILVLRRDSCFPATFPKKKKRNLVFFNAGRWRIRQCRACKGGEGL